MNKFIIMQIKEERCATPKVAKVGYDINKTEIDFKKQSNVAMDEDIELKKVQEQLSNKSFTKMCFSTNMTEAKRFNPETGYSYEIKQHDKLTNLLYKDALFNRFMARCVQLTCEDEETLVEMFAEFLTMMSNCENRKQDK